MTSRSHPLSLRPAPWTAVLVLGLAAILAPAVAVAGDEPAPDQEEAAEAAPTRTVKVGGATLNWHLQPAAPAQRSEMAEAFRKATRAHLTGGEPHATPKAEPLTLPGGQRMLRLPAELAHTMFVGPDGRNYCSDTTVAAKAAPVDAEGER